MKEGGGSGGGGGGVVIMRRDLDKDEKEKVIRDHGPKKDARKNAVMTDGKRICETKGLDVNYIGTQGGLGGISSSSRTW